jgi:hypothetical protein
MSADPKQLWERIFNRRNNFFDAGLRFACQRCGACCTGAPGTVYVAREEVGSLASFLGLSESELKRRYLYSFRGGYSVREHADGRCFFFDGTCAVYEARPAQCRSYPFWLQNLESERAWQRVRAECPGIGRGPLYSRESILRILAGSPL